MHAISGVTSRLDLLKALPRLLFSSPVKHTEMSSQPWHKLFRQMYYYGILYLLVHHLKTLRYFGHSLIPFVVLHRVLYLVLTASLVDYVYLEICVIYLRFNARNEWCFIIDIGVGIQVPNSVLKICISPNVLIKCYGPFLPCIISGRDSGTVMEQKKQQ